MSKIKNGGLDQYDAELFEQQQFGTSGVEWVNGAQLKLLDSPLEMHVHHPAKWRA